MYVHEAIARALRDNDVPDVFGVVGDANLFIIDSFTNAVGGTYVPMPSESGAVLAAIGYAQVTQRLGVATVTHGPGLTNTLTAMVEGVRARLPLVVLVGDTPLSKHDHIQDIDHRSVAVAAGAGFEQARSAESAAADIAAGIRRAWIEARPIVVNVPIDIQWQSVEYTPITATPAAGGSLPPAEDMIEQAAGVIASADRPVVLAGRGVLDADTRSAVLQFAQRVGAPVATTLRGKDMFADLAYNLGVFGTLSTEAALEVIGQSDCVVAFGAGLNEWTTAEGALLDGKRVVHVDIDASRINRYTPATVGVRADAASAARALIGLLDEADVKPTRFVDRATDVLSAARGKGERQDRGTDTSVDIQTALRLVDERVPPERVVVTDNGRFIKHAFTALHVQQPSLYVHAVSFGSIGLGMATALGASHGAPDRPVLLACGDGGFALGGLSDLVTAVTQHRNIIVLLLNDGAYGAEYVHLASRGMDPANTRLDWPDFGPIARAMGAQGATVRNTQELSNALQQFDFRNGPVLLDVRINPDHV
jgi:acetolactate synthase I/II/III large subunit